MTYRRESPFATHLTKKAGYTKTTAHTGTVTLIQLRIRRQSEYARIIPPSCNLLILVKQRLLFCQRVPIENEFARRLEPF